MLPKTLIRSSFVQKETKRASSSVLDVFDRIKVTPKDDLLLSSMLSQLDSTSCRKQASILLKTSVIQCCDVFRVWLAIINNKEDDNDHNTDCCCFSVNDFKLLSIALIWILDHMSNHDVLFHSYHVLQFLTESTSFFISEMKQCGSSKVEVTNDGFEQVLKAVASFLRKRQRIVLSHQNGDVAIHNNDSIWQTVTELDRLLMKLLSDSSLSLSKAVLSQCGMSYAGTQNFLQQTVTISDAVFLLPNSSLVCVLHGFMVVYSHNDICQYQELILQHLLKHTSSQDPVVLTLTMRTIALWTDIACANWSSQVDYSLYNPLSQRLEMVVWDLWETHVEMAKGHLREIFATLLKIHFKKHPDYEDNKIVELLERCVNADLEKKKPYHALQIIVDYVPSLFIVTQYPQLPKKLLTMLLDQSKSQVCQMTLIKMVHSHWSYLVRRSNHKADSDKQTCSSVNELDNDAVLSWRRIWVEELLHIQQNELSESFRVNAGFIQYIKFILKRDPACLKYILQRSDLKLVVRLMIIKSAADENLFVSSSNANTNTSIKMKDDVGTELICEYWRNMVPMTTMFSAVWSFSPQVLQDVLWLLIHPTKSTTEPLCDEDIVLLQEFYTYNLTNQSPAFRHNVYQWTNRLFLRMKDRLSMKKSGNDEVFWQSQELLFKKYKVFLLWMMSQFWGSFHLDCSYSHKHLCLQFVRDMLSIFDNRQLVAANTSSTGYSNYLIEMYQTIIDWIVEDGRRIDKLIALFHDSVQMNKDLALEILLSVPEKKLSIIQCYGTSEKLWKSAFLFARSLKSEKYPAAANLFQLLTLSPHLSKIVGVSDQFKDNTFLLVHFLTNHVSSMLDDMVGMKLLQATTSPVHGFLHCIYALLERVDFFDAAKYGLCIEKIISLCYTACEIVFPVVKQVAPEGYMPPDSQVVLALNDFKNKCTISENSKSSNTDCSKTPPVTAQMVVFCSWRIVKEACFILADIATKYKPIDNCAISAHQIVEISDYITKIVVESRHLGAFEKSFLALQKIVKFLWMQDSSNETENHQQVNLGALPDMWIDNVLDEVKDPVKAQRFCLTRRSAGVPRYLEALLTTSPALELPRRVDRVFNSLMKCAKLSEVEEMNRRSKIHALNILRYLFRCSSLGQLVHNHVTEGLKTSLEGFNSMLWPIQNASNLLFTAILSRVFGVLPDPMKLTRKNCMSCSEFFTKFPEIYDVIVISLESILQHVTVISSASCLEKSPNIIEDLKEHTVSFCDVQCAQLFSHENAFSANSVLYPVLLLLERLFVTENETKYYPILSLVLRFTGWPLIRIRTLVARVVPNFVLSHQSKLNLVTCVMRSCVQNINMNNLHGSLLTVLSTISSCENVDLQLIAEDRRADLASRMEKMRNYLHKQPHCTLVHDKLQQLEEQLNRDVSMQQNAEDAQNQKINFSSLSRNQALHFLQTLQIKWHNDAAYLYGGDSLLQKDLLAWFGSLLQSTDPFDDELVSSCCSIVVDAKLQMKPYVAIEKLIANFDNYTEQCQPSILLAIATMTSLSDNIDFAKILFDSISGEESEQMRLSVCEVLNFESGFLSSCVADVLCYYWAAAIILMFDDCPDVRKSICGKISKQVVVQTKDNEVVYCPMKLIGEAVKYIKSNFVEEVVVRTFWTVLNFELESCGLFHFEEEMIEQPADILFEPTELNTYKETFLLVEICSNAIGQIATSSDVLANNADYKRMGLKLTYYKDNILEVGSAANTNCNLEYLKMTNSIEICIKQVFNFEK